VASEVEGAGRTDGRKHRRKVSRSPASRRRHRIGGAIRKSAAPLKNYRDLEHCFCGGRAEPRAGNLRKCQQADQGTSGSRPKSLTFSAREETGSGGPSSQVLSAAQSCPATAMPEASKSAKFLNTGEPRKLLGGPGASRSEVGSRAVRVMDTMRNLPVRCQTCRRLRAREFSATRIVRATRETCASVLPSVR